VAALYGCVIFSGLTSESNSSLVRCPSFNAASRRLECSTCAVCAICAALSYPTLLTHPDVERVILYVASNERSTTQYRLLTDAARVIVL